MHTSDPLITRLQLTRILRVSGETMRRWLREKRLPPPDFALSSKTYGWKSSTLRAAGIDVFAAPSVAGESDTTPNGILSDPS